MTTSPLWPAEIPFSGFLATAALFRHIWQGEAARSAETPFFKRIPLVSGPLNPVLECDPRHS
jgi:hypothetical protein